MKTALARSDSFPEFGRVLYSDMMRSLHATSAHLSGPFSLHMLAILIRSIGPLECQHETASSSIRYEVAVAAADPTYVGTT